MDATDTVGDLRIVDGDVWAFFAFDIGYSVDIDAAQEVIESSTRVRQAAVAVASISPEDERTSREEIRHRRRRVSAPQFHPAPLRVEQPIGALGATAIGGFRLAPRAECTVYDFGAVSVGYRFPVGKSGEGLAVETILPLAQEIMEGAALRDDATRRARELSQRLHRVIDRPDFLEIVEDYMVVQVRQWHSERPDAMSAVIASGDAVARILLAEPGPLAQHAVDAAISARVAYAPTDAAVIDWSGALVLGPEEEDAVTVLEFANVELLEMRHLDDRLDAALDRAYGSLLRRDRAGRPPRSPLGLLFDPHRAERRWLADLQMESAVLFENANNTLKLVGDQHLARLYALAAARLHLADWDQSILRKLETVEGLYQKLAEEQAARRMELLEWIIIILIAVSIVIPFLPGVTY